MFDQLIFVTMAGAIVIAILALIKVMIDYPGFGDWCMRAIHKKTADKTAAMEEGEAFEEVLVDDDKVEAVTEKSVDKIDPAILRVTMSRTNTDPELCKRRLEDEIISLDGGTPDSVRRNAHHMRRHSHDHHHHRHHRHHHHRKYSHDYHHHHHHPGHGHHSSTDMEHSDPETRRKKRYFRRGAVADSPQGSSGTSHETVDMATDTKHSKNNMRININNVNILINRHLHKDVTINIDMEEDGEAGVVEGGAEHDHDHLHHDDHEVRSSDSGIGWDEHHVHDAEVHDVHDTHHPGEIEPIAEERETERNVIVEAGDNTEAKDILNKLDSLTPARLLPKRFRHNTFS